MAKGVQYYSKLESPLVLLSWLKSLFGYEIYYFSPMGEKLGFERCWLNATIEDDRFTSQTNAFFS